MTGRSVIENKISSTRKYLNLLDRYRKYSLEEIVNDIDRKGALERYLYLAIQASIDLAEAAIVSRNLRKPSTLGESFRILQEGGLIDSTLAEELVKMAGFRNIIAHDYESLNYEIVYDILQNRLADIERFVEMIAAL